MLHAVLCLSLINVTASTINPPMHSVIEQTRVSKVALFPWSFCENERGTSKSGLEMADTVLKRLFEEKGQMAIQPVAESRSAWMADGNSAWQSVIEDPKDQPQIPEPSKLLRFGRQAGVDYVVAGRLYWHVKSIWVGLGPKTKANATIDILIVDTKKGEVAYEVKGFKSDSTKAEKWYETGGALFLTWGITLFSGGPKTPQIERATAIGLGAATDDFFKSFTDTSRKILEPR